MAAVVNLANGDSDTEVKHVCEFVEPKAEPNNNNNYVERNLYAKRSKHDNVVGAWQPCEVLEKRTEKEYVVRYRSDHVKRIVPEYELASAKIPVAHELIATGTRIIVRRSSSDLPYTIDENDRKHTLLPSDGHFYPGIVAQPLDNRFLVFCDDGVVQQVGREFIRLVKGNDTYKHAHWNARPYFNFFVNDPAKGFNRLNIGQSIKVELNGVYENAVVQKVDAYVAQIHFINAKRFEWIYLGSPRISEMYRKLVKKSKLDNLIRFKRYMPFQSARDDILLIDTTRSDPVATPQLASDVRPPKNAAENSSAQQVALKIQSTDAFQRPMLMGWSRKGKDNIFYKTPDGSRCLHTLKEIDEYLARSNSELRIDCFDLSKIDVPDPSVNALARDLGKIDVSNGKEKIPTLVDGQMNLKFNYITSYDFDHIDVEKQNDLGRMGCNCVDNCRDKSKCSCWQLTVQRKLNKAHESIRDYKRHEKIGYKHMRLKRIVGSGIVECGGNCKCCAEKCVNRVAQTGMQHNLEVFRTKNKGWGVRTQHDLPAGIFITPYIGVVLTSKLAEESDTRFQFQLPTIDKAQQSQSDGSESDFGDSESSDDSDDFGGGSDSDDEPKMKRPRSYDVVQPFVNYFPLKMRGGNADHFQESDSKESHENADSYVIDGRDYGNISRFLNHSCDPNLFAQLVYIDDDKRFPTVAFFTSMKIKAGTELTIDYGYDLIDGRETTCLCGTSKCRKRLT